MNVISSYTDEEFKMHYRISRSLFKILSDKFSESQQYKHLRSDKRLLSDEHLYVFLWFAGHEACSYRDLSDRFNVTKSSVSRIIKRVTYFLSPLSPQVIKWPSAEERQVSSEYFELKYY